MTIRAEGFDIAFQRLTQAWRTVRPRGVNQSRLARVDPEADTVNPKTSVRPIWAHDQVAERSSSWPFADQERFLGEVEENFGRMARLAEVPPFQLVIGRHAEE